VGAFRYEDRAVDADIRMVYPFRYYRVIGFGDVELAWGRSVKNSRYHTHFFAFLNLFS